MHLAVITLSVALHAAPLKPRLVVLTDIGPHTVEPDDHESMVRLLAHADELEIEALIATTGWNTGNYPPAWMDSIKISINAYEKDLPKLQKRSGQLGFFTDEAKQEVGYWPTPAYLRSRTMLGSARMGYAVLGDNNNSAGSDYIIKLADESDERRIHIAVWGGGNTFAQAVWRVRKERTAEQLRNFLHKCRVYTITDQDKPWGSTVAFSLSSHQWLRREFAADLQFLWDECAWLYQNSTGVNRWSEYAANIQGHGNLGAIYPKYKWGVEGDTPSFLYLLCSGLSNPDVPVQTGWGGYFMWASCPDTVTSAYTNHERTAAYAVSNKYQAYFYPAIFNNFAARMDWAKDGSGNRNPVVVINGDSAMVPMTLKPAQGAAVTLDASGSFDPDANLLTFKWWLLPEAGTYTQTVSIANPSSNRITLNVPSNAAGKSFHVICEVTDNGTPPLTGYRRVMFEPVTPVGTMMPVMADRCPASVRHTRTAGYDLLGKKIPAYQVRFRGVFLRINGGTRIAPVVRID